MQKIQQVLNLKGRTALVRVDFNVPVGLDGKVDQTESFRIESALETLKFLQDAGAKTIVVSHIGRDKKESLKPVYEYLKVFLNINFVSTWDKVDLEGVVNNLQEGEMILLENIRQNIGEEKNDPEFSNWLASLADLYVNEAFAVSHRKHASVVGVPLYLPSYAGFWLQKEVENLNKVMESPEKPFLFILGGAKFDTKIPLLRKFEKKADEILIGGALANNFFKTIGFEIGKSLVDDKASVTEFFNKENIKIPFDVVIKTGPKDLAELKKDDMIVDLGPNTSKEWIESIKSSKTILLNGPLGFYEEGFDKASKEILKAIADSGAFSVVGGGDTVKLINDLKLREKFSFISTGGGAMLDYLSNGSLPGIEMLQEK